jgi:hypothetical protein
VVPKFLPVDRQTDMAEFGGTILQLPTVNNQKLSQKEQFFYPKKIPH